MVSCKIIYRTEVLKRSSEKEGINNVRNRKHHRQRLRHCRVYRPRGLKTADTVTFELIGRIEVDGCTYCAVIPEEEDENADSDVYVILKEVNKNDDVYLSTIDDDKEYDRVAKEFFNVFEELDEEEE